MVSKTKPVSCQGGRNELKWHQLFRPLPPKRSLLSRCVCSTDIWWFYRLQQLVKLSKSTQFCLPFCKVLNFCCIALAKIMYKLTSVSASQELALMGTSGVLAPAALPGSHPPHGFPTGLLQGRKGSREAPAEKGSGKAKGGVRHNKRGRGRSQCTGKR